MSWRPPERPRWAQRLIEYGNAVGGPGHLVSLEPAGLLDVAMSSTGLTDFGGDDGWRAHFHVLVRALEEESDLHLIGRIMVRTELIQALRNRLLLADLWKRKPAILEAEIDQPVFIVGSPRSGTSILHELMAQDPATRTPALWEMHHPVEALDTGAGDANSDGPDSWSHSADRVTQFWHDVQPEYETMHANSGLLPNECIFITLHEFLSDHWTGSHNVPSYARHLAKADQRPAYVFHKRFLQTLQERETSKRWLLKAPSHLFQMRTLFDVYPDARIIRTHRDPRKTLASAISLMGTLKWMRGNTVDMSRAAERLAFGYAYIYELEMKERKEGRLPDERFIDVRFQDIVRDPVGCVEDLYQRLGWPMTEEIATRIGDYAREKPKGAHGVHQYSLEEIGLDATAEAERFRIYMERFEIEGEDL